MGQILDFSEIKKSEKTIRKTWSEFRDALAKEVFTFDEVEKAKGYTFLKVYDDLFHQHSGIDHKTIKIKDAASVVKGLIHCVHLAFCVSGMPYHQVVFGASSIVGDLTYAIDAAFESIVEIEKNEDKELHMVDNVIFDRLLNDDEVELAKQIFVPSPNPTVNYNTSYGIFLGYTIGLDPNQYSVAEFPGIVEEKMQEDIRRNIDYILQKIRDNNLNLHSFYFYVLPFNDGETDKKDIMEAVLKGDVDL